MQGRAAYTFQSLAMLYSCCICVVSCCILSLINEINDGEFLSSVINVIKMKLSTWHERGTKKKSESPTEIELMGGRSITLLHTARNSNVESRSGR